MDQTILDDIRPAQPTEVEKMRDRIDFIRKFMKERERLGEYDASAQAIIELGKVSLMLAELHLRLMEEVMELKADRSLLDGPAASTAQSAEQ
jgi:hypothetical protein